MTKKQLLD